jgi:hypothetical protein
MLSGEFPASAILLYRQSMAGSEMPFEHLAAPATIEADDIITMNRLSDRHGRGSLSLDFGCRFSEADERLMNSRDQDRQLVGPDLVTADICSNNVGRAFSIER